MTKCAIICGLVFAFGCGSKGGMDGKLDDLSKIKDKMCQCPDKKCADDTRDEYVAWKKGNKGDKPSKDQDDRFQSIKKEMMDCRHKLVGAGDDSGGGTGGGTGHGGEMGGSGSAPAPAPAAGSGSGS